MSEIPLSQDKKRWRVLYPAYINKKFKLSQGRKITVDNCVEKPNVSEIGEICTYLKFPCVIEVRLLVLYLVCVCVRVCIYTDSRKCCLRQFALT